MSLNRLPKREPVNGLNGDIAHEHIHATLAVDPMYCLIAGGGYAGGTPAILLEPTREPGSEPGLVIDDQDIHPPPSLR